MVRKTTPPAKKSAGSATKKAAGQVRAAAPSRSSDSRKSVAKAPAKAARQAPAKIAKAPAEAARKAPAPTKATGKAAARAAAPSGAARKEAGGRPATARKAATPAKATKAPARAARRALASAPGAPGQRTAQRTAGASRTSGYAGDERFLEHQREALTNERATYLEQASSLQAEAQSLVEEMEPGDIQFDEESGEGGTVTVDRERDLALSAQALAAVEEIDDALAKIRSGRYGICEGCGDLIPKARLEALPYARLCISCKAGGLSRR